MYKHKRTMCIRSFYFFKYTFTIRLNNEIINSEGKTIINHCIFAIVLTRLRKGSILFFNNSFNDTITHWRT